MCQSRVALLSLALVSLGLVVPLRPAPAEQEDLPSSGIATLYAKDPEWRTMSFADGRAGSVMQKGKVFNRQSDIDFDGYGEGAFTVGIEGGRDGAIVDLGTSTELQRRYGYDETVGGGQGFASITRIEGDYLILQDYAEGSLQRLAEADALHGVEGNGSAPVAFDHVYLLRLVDRHDDGFERVVKLHVVEHVPGQSVTVRWVRIDD